ncbi:MAG: DUF2975 domain-containing protein [Oscillospiraceae bacterium]|nr:DUF2975 domain-containing protein [Oscillospiraceae bacterium]
MEKSITTKILLVLLSVILCVGIASTFFIPMLYDLYRGAEALEFSAKNIFYQVAFYSIYLICLVIIYVLIKILKSVHSESPFKVETEKKLKIITVLFMLIAIIVGIKFIFIPTVLSLAIAVLSFIASQSFYVLSQLFKMATAYKHEIDFTV